MENFAANTQVYEYTLKRFVLLGLLLFTIPFVYAQELSTANKKARKLYEKADKAYQQRDFNEAILLLEESVKNDNLFFEAYARMGSLYQAIGQEDSVYSKFQLYVKTAPDPIASVLEKLAFLAFDRGYYSEAEEYLTLFLEKVPEMAMDFDIDLLFRSIDFVKSQHNKSGDSVVITYLPKEINRFKLQYLPSVTIDDASIFYTKRDHVNDDEDIVVSHRKDGKWQPAQSVSSRINSPLNEGACTVSADGRTMIFTSCDGKNALGSCDLYISKKTGDQWSYPKNLGKTVNSIYWESQPTLSADGKTLYFSSNRRGGFGGRDIWVTQMKNGSWTKPKNLGNTINSPKDETTPFIHPNGVDLYFSSNGYPGMGGYDLYMSHLQDTIWSAPVNLGSPINTYKDEVSIVINASGTVAYFAKEEQKNYEILDSRLVTIDLTSEISPEPATYVVGTVFNAKTNVPIGAEVQVISLTDNKTIYEASADSITGTYYMVLPTGLELAAYVKKKGYLFSDFHFTTGANYLRRPDTINIPLTPVQAGEKLILRNIYFEIDSYELDDKSLSEIELVEELLRENNDITVEISGHTDSTGDPAYNLQLSHMRAKAVHDELVRRGISEERLTYKGYGDSQPIASNETEEGRKSNRRIEFRVIRSKP